MADEYDYLFKSIVVGDGGVGKTALTLRFSKGFFTEDYKMTIGVDFHVKTISIDTSEGPIKCKLQLWDTGGQERFSSIRPMYYRGSLGTILVFDLTNSASFEHLPQWIEEVRANIKAEIPVLLVGNKSDLIDQRAVSAEEISKFTKDFNLYYMETSAKTGDGVGDCFYILACLMIGQGVPEQLVANTTVYAPGHVIKEGVQISLPRTPSSEPQDTYIAPPVPEPTQIKEVQPEIEFEAPPVPEPKLSELIEPAPHFESEPEIEFEAPPVPEPAPTTEPQYIPEISIPEQTEIEFKTPDEILIKDAVKSELEALNNDDISKGKTLVFDSVSDDKIYKPKTIPFTSNVPEPAPPPKEFQSSYSEKLTESTISHTPFRVIKREEPLKPQPASMTFEPNPKPQPDLVSESPIFQPPTTPASSSDSLIDYMPQAIINKKEKKKKAKEKKKQDKEKAKIEKEKKNIEEQEKQEKLIEAMKKSKKDKKEKKSEPTKSRPSKTSTPTKPTPEIDSLFQTLAQKTEDSTPIQSVPFMPLVGESKPKEGGTSKLRIIPNVADIEAESNAFTAFTPTQPAQEEKPKNKSKDLLICEQCGSILSSDYTFCNKCGNKL
ncbi:MAG: GTP-binding protein [Candidatus Lokiarchaeota archaeon]|nr:GTP-binding protein [Candidatus Lokiarchaeota archaeon]